MTPKNEAAKEDKPLRLLGSKLELPWACCGFFMGRAETAVLRVCRGCVGFLTTSYKW